MANPLIEFSYVVATDRGGHLHNALKLVEQIGTKPFVFVTTHGPDIDALKKEGSNIFQLPHLFKWFGKRRVLNLFQFLNHFYQSFQAARKLKGIPVVSVGASNVVMFCYCAWILGADIFHVECMNQVNTPSQTARLLYPIVKKCYVQWEDLLPALGPKAVYRGWVL